MRKLSILLCLDGSLQSKYAAEVCWSIASNIGASVTAQHVIDTNSAHDFITKQPAGFVNEDCYTAAYEAVHKKLYELAEILERNYLLESTRHGVRTDFVVDEGDPIKAITRRASGYDLVIIGHKPQCDREKTLTRKDHLNLSVAEALAHECPKPLLVVQGPTPLWSEMTVLLSAEHLNENYVNACLDFASLLELKTNLTCLTSGAGMEPVEKFVHDLRQADSKLKDVPIEVGMLADLSLVDGEPLWKHFNESEARRKLSTLAVIPTRSAGGNRVTVLDGSPTLFVRFLSLTSMLLLPEEHLLKV